MNGTIMALRGYRVRIFDLDAQCNASETLCCGPDDLAPGQKTVWQLIQGEAGLSEVTTQARYYVGQKPDNWDSEADGEWEEFAEIPNLTVVPGDPEMKNCEMLMSTQPETFTWFWDLITRYATGDLVAEKDEVWLLDLPANFGSITVSILYGMDEDDEVLPPVRVTGKEQGALNKMVQDELPAIVERYRRRAAPARPRVHHVLLCDTPTSSHDAVEYHRTVQEIEEAYPDMVLPYVRHSNVITSQYRRRCPIRISDPNQRPTKDYTDVVDALGFPDLEVSES
jgi:cellulose biosynthesis protein BcsQ